MALKECEPRRIKHVLFVKIPPSPSIEYFKAYDACGCRLRLEAEEEPEAFRWISMLNAAHRIGAEVDLLHCRLVKWDVNLSCYILMLLIFSWNLTLDRPKAIRGYHPAHCKSRSRTLNKTLNQIHCGLCGYEVAGGQAALKKRILLPHVSRQSGCRMCP